MILDELPLELMREVLLDLPTVDIIQTVKCIRRLYHFAKADKALGRRLQNRVFDLRLRPGKYKRCADCGKFVLRLYLDGKFRQANDAAQWKSSNFVFLLKGDCKYDYVDGLTPGIEPSLLNYPSFLYEGHLLGGFENETSFTINNGSLDEAIVNCGKLFNILMKFCVVRKFKLDLENNDYQMWEQMNAFFNANPPDLRIQPCISIPSNINLDDFLTSSIFQNGLAEIAIFTDYHFGRILPNAYHEVFRRTSSVSFFRMDLPYTYKDLFGFFKNTKKLSLRSATHITDRQISQLVQHFYEVKQDEERTFEIMIGKGFLVKDFLRLIPKKAYKLYLKRNGFVGPKRKWIIWAEMTDRFDGRWALMIMAARSYCPFLRIFNMKYLTKDNLIELSNQSGPDQSDSDQSDSDQSDSDQSDSDQSDSDLSDFD
ncbi:hypothetical protein WR25_16748 [Diploscapter pachys]|uniref:F-box domain-containing protein n=1 Tax=Diploscapter pachys TaxID=2018661 RepID=A0A2A2J678_9BILA|nr:hypothetical protein WR25_16748 [Diploscapter pachys]